jgi:hypothetical protein
VQLRLGETEPRALADMWDQFFNRLLECILVAFKRRVEMYEDEIRALMVDRNSPDFNYSRFYVLKVCRAQ